MTSPIKVAIFASGGGSNAQSIITYSQQSTAFDVVCIITNKKTAGVLEIARDNDIESVVFTRSSFYETNKVISYLQDRSVELIILAGFLWLIPENLVRSFENRILNIHPSLLPKYGGKGMYGMHVHNAVKENEECESGLTIHQVNSRYDEGGIIFQTRCQLNDSMGAEDIARKVLRMEHFFYSRVIESIAKSIKIKQKKERSDRGADLP